MKTTAARERCFWLYYRNYLLGKEYILPAAWRNGIMSRLGG